MEIARILVYGDIHLSSKNYGAHRDYAKDSLDVLKSITAKANEIKATHIIGLGDFAYGRFNTLEFRAAVEAELEEQYMITNGNRFELKGNHDAASYGMTEYEYYIQKGLLKPSVNLTIGNIHITMVDYGKAKKIEFNHSDSGINVIFAHDYLTFSDAHMPNFGRSIELDNFDTWYGVDHIVCGHIHSAGLYEGLMIANIGGESHGKRVTLDYLGSMTRPSYLGENTDTIGHMLVLTIYDNGNMKYDRLDIELPSLSETFNIEAKQIEEEKKAQKEKRLDISDIVHQLDSHERAIGNPEDIIMGLSGIDERYKLKAIELLKWGSA